MKCKSCSEEISQKFSHAIATNICPFCGQEIMSLELQVALSELCEVMKATDQFQPEIFDWLHSNYQLISKESDEYKALKEKAESVPQIRQPAKAAIQTMDPNDVALDRNGNQISGALIQDQATTNVFMQRAQIKPEQKNLRDIVSQIKKSGGVAASITADADPEDVAAMEAELGGGSLGTLNGGSMEYDEMGSDEDAIPAVVEAMAIQASGGAKGADYNARDVAKLQQLHGKRSRASSELIRGGGVGLIRRG